MKKLDLTIKLIEWLNKNQSKSLEGKHFFTRYDVLKSVSESENLGYEKLNKFVIKHTQLNDYLNDWLNNNFWHVMVALKIPKGIELYIDSELSIKAKKTTPSFFNDIPSHKEKLSAFVMNNEIDDSLPNIQNQEDIIFNLGKKEDFDELDIPIEESEEYDT